MTLCSCTFITWSNYLQYDFTYNFKNLFSVNISTRISLASFLWANSIGPDGSRGVPKCNIISKSLLMPLKSQWIHPNDNGAQELTFIFLQYANARAVVLLLSQYFHKYLLFVYKVKYTIEGYLILAILSHLLIQFNSI